MLLPLLIMLALTFLIGFRLFYLRVHSVKYGKVKAGYYRLKEGQGPDRKTQQAENAYNSQFQMPILFYLSVILAELYQLDNLILMGLVWAFVILRIIHALILMGPNILLYRMMVFWLSTLDLIAIWCLIAWLHF